MNPDFSSFRIRNKPIKSALISLSRYCSKSNARDKAAEPQKGSIRRFRVGVGRLCSIKGTSLCLPPAHFRKGFEAIRMPSTSVVDWLGIVPKHREEYNGFIFGGVCRVSLNPIEPFHSNMLLDLSTPSALKRPSETLFPSFRRPLSVWLNLKSG